MGTVKPVTVKGPSGEFRCTPRQWEVLYKGRKGYTLKKATSDKAATGGEGGD